MGECFLTRRGLSKEEQSKTVTPTASGFTVTPDANKVLSSVIVNGDSDLIASNVKNGVNIFGVTGTLVESATPAYGVIQLYLYAPSTQFGNMYHSNNSGSTAGSPLPFYHTWPVSTDTPTLEFYYPNVTQTIDMGYIVTFPTIPSTVEWYTANIFDLSHNNLSSSNNLYEESFKVYDQYNVRFIGLNTLYSGVSPGILKCVLDLSDTTF